MKQIAILLTSYLIITVLGVQYKSPTWIINPNIDSGQVIPVDQNKNLTFILTPTANLPYVKTYNKTTFEVIPNVMLSMIGYLQYAPSSSTLPFGFHILITGRSQTGFTYNITTYGSRVLDLHYLYLAIQHDTSVYYMTVISQIFNSSSNLANSTATQRWEVFPLTNPSNWTNSNYSTGDVQVMAFPLGYQLAAQSARSYISINASIINESAYRVNISTIGSNILTLLDFSILMFNRGPVVANYSVYNDIMISNVIGNTPYYINPTITSEQYMFRNFLTGAVHIEFNLSGVVAVGFYYSYSSASDDFFVWRTFNNRVRSCPSNLTYYDPIIEMCQDQCAAYYYANSTYSLCFACHYSCLNCSQANSSNSCTSCASLDFRDLINSSCVCSSGYYEKGVSMCGSCNFRCLTCSGGISTNCLSCNSSLSRSLSNSTNECLCNVGYYQNFNCYSCNSQIKGCASCFFNTFFLFTTCGSCNSSLNRTLKNNACVCISGYYENLLLNCQICPVGCLSCTFNSSMPICSSCNASLSRGMGNSNLSCDCLVGLYSDPNNICQVCPVGCISCAFNGSMPICSSCNASLSRGMGNSNLSCDCLVGLYSDTSQICEACPLGCLSCYLNSSLVLCSSCNSSLSRFLSSDNTSCLCMQGLYQSFSNLCISCQLGCSSCYFLNSSVICSICNSSLSRMMGVGNLSCDCPIGKYQDGSNSCLPCPSQCVTCSSNIFCLTCLSGYYLNGNNTCTVCSIGCLVCNFNTSEICNNCDSNSSFQLQNDSCVCLTSTILNGTICSLISNSTNTTNTTNGTSNSSNCGNGVLQNGEFCDDNNVLNLDGCSSSCLVETDHSCLDNHAIYNYSLCYYSRQIKLNPKLIYKIPGENSVLLRLSVHAPNCNSEYLKLYLQKASSLALYDKTRLLTQLKSQSRLLIASWISVPTKTIAYDPATGILTITFDYDATINLAGKYIQFIPSNSINSQGIKYFYASPSAQLSLQQPYNHLTTTYYPQSDLSSVQNLKYAFIILIFCYWAFLIIAITRKRGAVGMQCMMVLQFTYFTLIDQSKIFECWSGFQLTGKYTFGFNPLVMSTTDQMDLKGLQVDSNLINVLNIILGFQLIIFSGIMGVKIYDYMVEKKRIQQMMQMNETQQNYSVKNDKGQVKQVKFIDKIMIYVIDSFLSMLFLLAGIYIIVLFFTNTLIIVPNLTVSVIFIGMSITFWVSLAHSNYKYSYRSISYKSMIIEAKKTQFHPVIKQIVDNYYLLMYILIILTGIIISLLRKKGIGVYAIIIVGCICLIVFHSKYKIYFQTLESKRSILNNIVLILLMIIHILSSLLYDSLGTGFNLVLPSFLLLIALLIANAFIFIITTCKQLKKQRQQCLHKEEMKQMDNELALANISFIGAIDNGGYNSINKSRDHTKHKDFLNSFDFSSAKRKLLNDDQALVFNMIQEKIKELKDFKRNILQTGQDSSRSQQFQLDSVSANITLDNVLRDLNLTREQKNEIEDL